MVSLTYRTQDLVKIDNESFELEHIFKCDRNILVLPHQLKKSVLGKLKSLISVRQWYLTGLIHTKQWDKKQFANSRLHICLT